MKHGWLWLGKGDMGFEKQQLIDEGRDIASMENDFDRLMDPGRAVDASFQAEANELLDRAATLPMRREFPYAEPSELDAIRALRPSGTEPTQIRLSDAEKKSAIHGAWLGRCAGCLLGKPIEGTRRPQLAPLLERTETGTITDYLWKLPGLSDEDYRDSGMEKLLNWKGAACMPEDDDTNYTVTGMAVVKEKGIQFTPEDVADWWMRNMPILHACTAERAAYRNFVNNIEPPRSAVVRNPYREWIGAQIRADFFGYVALGNPELAAELAWRDACISHVKNGIYGEMWVAAMLAAAPGASDMHGVIEAGLGQIPETCRLAEAVRDVLRRHREGMQYADAVERVHTDWNEHDGYHWCHTISNALVVAIGLLYSEGDFEKAITRSVQPCFDTDCNGATVGSIMGMALGAEALPAKWTDTMNDTVRTGLAGYNECKISGLAGEMFRLHQQHADG